MEKKGIAVVKIGTQVLSTEEGELDVEVIGRIALEIHLAIEAGWRVVVVSSGAMLAGRQQLRRPKADLSNWPVTRREESTEHRRILSCLGQAELIRTWQRAFEEYGYPCAQMLLTNEHFTLERYKQNLREMLDLCLEAGGIPVLNENDFETADEWKNGFSDNDELARLTATTIKADKLILLTSVDGYFSEGQLVAELTGLEQFEELTQEKSESDVISRGGMKSKLKNALLAMAAGIDVYIANGLILGAISDILLHGKNPGTFGRGRKAA